MKKHVLILVFILIFLLQPFFETSVHAPGAQPPVQTDTLYVGRSSWGPARADPARAYDTLSGELISNVYETLITYNDELYYEFVPILATNVPIRVDTTIVVTNTSAVETDPTGSTWTSGLTCVGFNDFNGVTEGLSQGDVLYMTDGSVYRTWYIQSVEGTYTLTLWRGSYTFSIRTSPTIYFWNETGAAVDAFDVDDAEYSFKRGLVQDQSGSPQWMYYKALFGTMNSEPWDADSVSRFQLANLINNAIEKSGNDLTINLGIPFPDNAFKQILSGTSGSIVSKQYSISIGCWDGNLLNANPFGDPDWWDSSYVRHKSRSPYDTIDAYRWVGTGPYSVAVFSPVDLKVVLQRNTLWWQGWPYAGRKSMLSTIELDYISDWSARKAAFLSEAIDICDVPRANMFELLQANNTNAEPILIDGKRVIKRIKNIVPTLSLDSFLFTFVVNPSSSYIGSGHFPDGIPTDFFNNTHTRKAFAYSFNATQYEIDSYYGEADYRKNPLAAGLYPDYYDNTVPGYTYNLTAAKLELQAAMFGGTSVWDSGFKLTLTYNTGNDMRRIACEMTRDFFGNLSTYGGRVGNPFQVDLENIDWGVYAEQFEAGELPIGSTGWSADFADADDFMRPYMHSYGDFAYFQNYTADNGWGSLKDSLLDQALLTPDGLARQALYQQLAMIYYNDVPSITATCPRGRRWCLYWVKGWYYNAMYPGDRYNLLYKEDTPWEDVTGTKAGVPDGRVNILDVSYVIEHFNAKAPLPGLPIDPKWVGTYGMGCPDVDGDRLAGPRDIQAEVLYYGQGFPQEQEHGGSVDLAVETSKKVVEINYDVTAAVKVKNIVNFTGYELCLFYDGSLLEIENWTVEPIPGWNLQISGGGGSFGSQNYLLLDVTSGNSMSLTRFSGDATLVTLIFKGLAEGNATLDISRSTLGVSDTDSVEGSTLIRGKIYNPINDVVSVVPYFYNIAIDSLTSKSVIGRGYCANISTALSNYCNHTESFNVAAYCNTINFANLTDLAVADRSSTSTALVWNTTGFAFGNYTIWAYAEPLPGEDVNDNNCTCAVPVHVGVPGDVSGPTQGFYDGTTNMRDINYLIQLFNTSPLSPNWNPDADINNDGTVNMRDIQIAILNFNNHE